MSQFPSGTDRAVATGQAAPVAGADPVLVHRGFREQREILGDQRNELQNERQEVVRQLRAGPAGESDATGLNQRLAQIDQRLAQLEIQIAEADAKVAQSAAVPGAVVPELRDNPWQYGPPEELVMMGIFFSALLAMPLVIAWARRIWRRSPATMSMPAELTERMAAVERSLESVAIEVERIGEGQRFVTQLMAERASAPAALPAAPPPPRN